MFQEWLKDYERIIKEGGQAMTKEQEEAIEGLKSLSPSESDIETVLNMLKEKIAEVEIHTGLEHFYKKEYLDKLELLREANAKLKEKDEEIEKKDKIIDLMAKYISGLDIDEDICKEQAENYGCDDINREVECKECVKKYFERKASE